MRIALLNGSRFIVVFNDNRSCKSWVYFFKSKEKTLENFKEFKAMTKIETSNKIKFLSTNRRG